jgi:hypothetical protein
MIVDTEEIGSVRLARVGGKLATSYNHHPEYKINGRIIRNT